MVGKNLVLLSLTWDLIDIKWPTFNFMYIEVMWCDPRISSLISNVNTFISFDYLSYIAK